VRIPARDRVTQVGAGGGFSLARTPAGQVLAWGHNTFGQLGDATFANSDVPVRVKIPLALIVIALAAGPPPGTASPSLASPSL